MNPNNNKSTPERTLQSVVGHDAPAHDFCLAPMRGLTDGAFRTTYARHFGGLDRCLAPFIETVTGERVKSSLLVELAAARVEPLPVVPQVLANAEGPLAVMLEALAGLGFQAVNLNAGCPWRRIIRKGRGAGLLETPDRLRRLLDAGCSRFPAGFSVKIRLGVGQADALAKLMSCLNAYPLSEVMVHPRTAVQGYAGDVDLEAFAACLALSRHALVYNGDIRTLPDWERLRARFPAVRRWMIGRGLLADPFLPETLRCGRKQYDAARLRAFLCDYQDACRTVTLTETAALGRLKALWTWLAEMFAQGEVLLSAIRRTQTLGAYDALLERVFNHDAMLGERPGSARLQPGILAQRRARLEPGVPREAVSAHPP